jgi:hypothetical protein
MRSTEGQKEAHSRDGTSYIQHVTTSRWRVVFDNEDKGEETTREKARARIRALKKEATSAGGTPPKE